MSNVLEYLDSKNINYSLVGNEAILTCPDCGKNKLSINIDTELYQCFVCKAENSSGYFAGGNLSKLKEYFGDLIRVSKVSDRVKLETGERKKEVNFNYMVEEYHSNLYETKEGIECLKYLYHKRKISDEAIKHFKLGFVRKYNQNFLAIPSFDLSGIAKLLKYRKVNPEDENPDIAKYIREKGSDSILFNLEAINNYDEIIISEGELDCISAWQVGIKNIVGCTGGAGTLKPEWYDQLSGMKKIYLIFDGDPPGQKAARDIWAERLGKGRCWNVELPEGYDINKIISEGLSLSDYLDDAYRFEVNGIVSLKDTLIEMYRLSKDETHEDVLETPWESLNNLIGGGFKRKRLTVLAGNSGVGKTSLATQILYHISKKYELPTLLFCLEMPEVSLATKVIQLEKDLEYDEINYSEALTYLDTLEKLPMYFGYSSRVTPRIFYNTMVEARNRYGIELAVFDNLHRMIRTGEEADYAKASGMFKDLSMDLNIPFILICQSRKTNSDRALTFDDLRGARAIADDADSILLMNRQRNKKGGESVFEDEVEIKEDKGRYSGSGRIELKLIGEKSKFVEIDYDN